MPFFKPINAVLFVLLFSSSIACIGFGGCLLQYPNGGCATSVTGYLPHCYGGYCRKNKAKGLRMMAMNKLGEKGGEREKGHERTDDKQHNSRKEQTNDDQFTPLEVSPDTLFLECCQSWSLPPSCLPKCSYTNYTAEMLRSMFFRSDDCPIESASIIHFCASQNLDHSLCCRQNGILTTRSGEKCLIFCEQLPKNETRLDLSYVPCFERFAEMKKCFYESALRTIDYLESEFDQLKNDDKLNEERGEALKTSTEENERAETENGGTADTFTIAKPPIIFVNDHTMKHPNINDNFTPTEGKRKRWNKNGEEQMKREAKKERKREE